MERKAIARTAGRLQFSAAERNALAAALIVGVMLVGRFHAPIGAVLAGCTLAFAGLLANRWRKSR
jgi:hypothetical protein